MMKISLNWLNDYIDLEGIPLQVIVDKLTFAGLEVEEIIDQAQIFGKMIVGYVTEAKKHPNADKLIVCKVNDGKEEYSVVCGAPNVAVGQKVPFARVGAVIPSNNLKLEKVKIRGEVSFGMICSEKELGISENHESIMVLDPSQKEGTPLADALGLNDIILDVAITPNRADALSHIGIARDLSAILNKPLKLPNIDLKESSQHSEKIASVEILDPINCPRYIGKVVQNVEIKESPDWLRRRLKSIGLRPINNVVDVTNFVLNEVGQPLHAFDLDYLYGKKIVVKCASNKEKFVTLDSKERTLNSKDLMICDGNKPVAIAGVMGGENSEVTSRTKNILIESAFFNPSSVRKTAKRLGLSTDASYRFERGTDPNITKWAAKRAAQLIQMTAGGQVASGEIDAYPKKIQARSAKVRFSRIARVLGYDVSKDTVQNILQNLGFEITGKNSDELTLNIPSYRHDIEREIDVIEEVARIYGYEKIPEVNKITVTLEPKVDQSAFVDRIRNILTSLGYYEILTNSLLKEQTACRFGNAIKMLNPQSSEMSHLRPSMLPGMLQAISNNLKVSERNLMFFEIGKVFEKKHEKEIKSFADFDEKEHLILALTGYSLQVEWYEKERFFDFFDLKGYVFSFLKKLFPNNSFQSFFNKGKFDFTDFEYSVENNSEKIGKGGKVKKAICDLFDINQDVYIYLFELDRLKRIQAPKKVFRELLKFPKIYRDFAFVLDKSIESDTVIEVVKGTGSKLLHSIKLFDIFQSDSLGKSKKSLAFQLEYYDPNRTLTEEEVDKDFRKAIETVEKKLNAQLRGI